MVIPCRFRIKEHPVLIPGDGSIGEQCVAEYMVPSKGSDAVAPFEVRLVKSVVLPFIVFEI